MTGTAGVLPPEGQASSLRNRLDGSLGSGAIIFMVVAAAAPLTVIGGGFPLAALLGNGVGAPAMFAVSGAILLLFAVGLATMSRFVSKPGAFFTYVGYGLGRPSGLAAAWIAILTYVSIQLCVYGFIGLMLGDWMADKTGLDLPWWTWSLILVAVVAVLGYRHIELSTKVLGVLLIAEVGIVVILAVVILFQGGADGISAESFEPATITSGSPGLALMFCMAGFIGFEATAIFRDEAREPEKTIPRATYGAVLLIAVFYTLTSWAIVQGWGAGFMDAVAADPAGLVAATGDRYLGSMGAEMINLLLITSLFACILSFHNVITRYAHSMSNAGLLPSQLGTVHESHESPHVSSLITSMAGFVSIALFALFGLDPYLEVFTWFSGIATVAIVVLMALTCAAVIAYFARNKVEATVWHTTIAPGLGFIGLAVATYILFANFSLLLGDVDAQGAPRVGSLTITFLIAMAAFPVFGLAQAAWLKRSRPAVYETVVDTISE